MPTDSDAKAAAAALQAYLKAADALGRLDAVRRLGAALDGMEQATIAAARDAGFTWREIAAKYQISKQAAQQRFRVPEADASTGHRRKRPSEGTSGGKRRAVDH